MVAKLETSLLSALARSLVAQGLISSANKTRREVEFEAIKYYTLNKVSFDMVSDHAPTVLSRARAEIRNRQWPYAVLFVALFFEHWINSVLRLRAERFRLGAEQVKEILRTDNRLKWGFWLGLLHLPAIKPARHNQIKLIMDLRNEFVHYKYPILSEDGDGDLERRCEAAVAGVGGIVKYLQRYKSKHIYSSETFRGPSLAKWVRAQRSRMVRQKL